MNPIKNKKDLEASIEEIKKFAYAYLDKYNPSQQQLKTYLFKKFIKKNQNKVNKKEIFNLIDTVINILVDQKFLSDKYYSEAKSRMMLRKGYSLNKIRYNLINKGIDPKYKEAYAFAMLAASNYFKIKVDTRHITGAKDPYIIGEKVLWS